MKKRYLFLIFICCFVAYCIYGYKFAWLKTRPTLAEQYHLDGQEISELELEFLRTKDYFPAYRLYNYYLVCGEDYVSAKKWLTLAAETGEGWALKELSTFNEKHPNIPNEINLKTKPSDE